jgi:hypothetical protein
VQRPTRNEWIASVEMAAVAEVAYLDRDPGPRVLMVTPLLLRGAPAFTLTYADSSMAHDPQREQTTQGLGRGSAR